MADILPLVQNAVLVNGKGNFTVQFKIYLDSLQERVGGVSGGIYNALAVTSSAFSWDLNASPIASVVLVNGTNTMTILNAVAGFIFPYRLTVIQPSSGLKGTISWPANVKFTGGTAPTLSTANNAVDEFWFVSDGTNIRLMVEGINFS